MASRTEVPRVSHGGECLSRMQKLATFGPILFEMGPGLSPVHLLVVGGLPIQKRAAF